MAKYFFLILSVFLFSCKKQKDLAAPEREQASGDYYPLAIGSYRIYDVRQTTYAFSQKYDSTYQLKETIIESFLDLEGGESYKIARYKKKPPIDTFQLDSVWYCKLSKNREVIVVENNVPFVKLSYPLTYLATWNGNKYNSLVPETYVIGSLKEQKNGFSDVVLVAQRNDTNLLRRDFRQEAFAQNIGLVYKKRRTVNFSSSAADFGRGVIISGIVLEQNLISYGQE